jgi:hypothetical protein
MRQALALHPDSRCAAVTRIEVEAARPRPRALLLRYLVTGAIRDIRLPPAAAPARVDGLWRSTCFEAFLRAPPSEAYCEFNFAPSTEWAAYRFDSYREGMRAEGGIAAPRLEIEASGERLSLSASLDLAGVPDLPGDAAWRLGLSAVIEEADGRKSYWALAHPPGRPDFHRADCFLHELRVVS